MPNQGATAQFLQAWAGTYTTELANWGAYFSPLVIDADGQTATLAGADLSLTLDQNVLTFDWTPIGSTTAKGSFAFGYNATINRVLLSGNINPRPQDGPIPWNGSMTEPTLPPAQADPIFQTVAASIAQAITNGGRSLAYHGARSLTNPVLDQLSIDPLAVLQAHGMPRNALDNADSGVRLDFVNYIKQKATSELEIARNGVVPMTYHFAACWSCRIGFGAIVVGLGAAISVVTLGSGTPAYAALLAALTSVLGAVSAVGIMAGSAAAISGGFTALIEYICESIPDTCI